jgi:hypothetical protein
MSFTKVSFIQEFTQELYESQSVSTFKITLTLHKKILSICESLAKVLALYVSTTTGRDECITEEILPVLLDALAEHPTSMPLLTSIVTMIRQFSTTEAGKQACITAGCQEILNTISS